MLGGSGECLMTLSICLTGAGLTSGSSQWRYPGQKAKSRKLAGQSVGSKVDRVMEEN